MPETKCPPAPPVPASQNGLNHPCRLTLNPIPARAFPPLFVVVEAAFNNFVRAWHLCGKKEGGESGPKAAREYSATLGEIESRDVFFVEHCNDKCMCVAICLVESRSNTDSIQQRRVLNSTKSCEFPWKETKGNKSIKHRSSNVRLKTAPYFYIYLFQRSQGLTSSKKRQLTYIYIYISCYFLTQPSLCLELRVAGLD